MDSQAVIQTYKETRPASRRRQFIVDSAFQWKYTLAIVVGVFLVASAMGITMFGYMHQQARQSTVVGRTFDSWHNTKTIVLFAILFSSVTVAGLMAWGIVMTHRVCGPLTVLKNNLTTLRNGQFPRYRALRKRDEFKELHSSFFELVDVLRSRAEQSLEALDGVLSDLDRLTSCDEKQRTQAIESASKTVSLLRHRLALSLESPQLGAMATSDSTQTSMETAVLREPSGGVASAR